MEQPKRRTTEQILSDLMAGNLDIADISIREVVEIEKIDCSGDEKKLVEKRTFIDGACTEILKF